MNSAVHSRTSILADQRYFLHIALFIATALCTLWAGAFWTGHPVDLEKPGAIISSLSHGTTYAASLLLFLGVHEFGHFFAALHHRIRATLPYFIPVPPLPFLLNLGTMGAVIKIKERIPDTRALFDTGASGPLAGFVVSLGLLVYGFLNLPPESHLYLIHPEYVTLGGIPDPPMEGTLYLGKNILWILLEVLIRPDHLPPMTEMYHYPFLFTGWIGSFVTALNLLPVGQLDGGHISYAMFGRRGHFRAATIFLWFIFLLALPSFLELTGTMFLPDLHLRIPDAIMQWSWPGWMFWFLILWRVIRTTHPPTSFDHPLDSRRMIIGWIAILIFVISFTPIPFGII
ncbi:MAG: site-2 protease family protein [Chlorobium sp.]|uniref:site-2 protease family protein n=1 Tax=Chlorobium sp. TaxID=1095 RepID=UPI0025C73FFF|nr:site-2 protease family protein [Chlorobium sp.]MCF8216472.1 site-2 protease family protein [Chlorobium sp.]MCF8271362.1 site-2 protease family protein [Chlorobium sp.]MCF8287749.1 site-2 protease family protein [Chlorobium sp.]MCF8291273.1 site-2 protease family protein [Chlorobium sp.]MCF8385368.1 site-2 protease family protein [Chlorobium sp.]